MAFTQNFPLFCILLCVISVVACLLFPRRESALRITATNFSLITIMSVLLLAYVAGTGEAVRYRMGQFPAPFGNELRFGTYEALMATVFSAVSLLSVIGGVRDVAVDIAEKKIGTYYLMLNLLMCAMLAIIYTNDIFTAYVFVDVITIAACSMIVARRSGKTLVATTTYLIISLIGSTIILLSIAILYSVTGHLLLENLGESVRALVQAGEYDIPLTMVSALFVIGLGVKSALFPFHIWLPDAHGSATTTSSAILSGILIKVYMILLIKALFRVFGPGTAPLIPVMNLLFIFGIFGVLWGSIKATRQKDIKSMLAYSSISQVGFICAGVGLGMFESVAAVSYHILATALSKAMLFCSAGALSAHCGYKKDFDSLRGAARKSPVMGVAFAVGSFSMIGIPPLPGFFSKIFVGSASIGSPLWLPMVFVVLVFASVLSAMYYVPAILCLFTTPVGDENVVRARENRPALVSVSVFMLLNFSLGVFCAPVLRLLEQGLSVFS